jgi:hypothetical protein
MAQSPSLSLFLWRHTRCTISTWRTEAGRQQCSSIQVLHNRCLTPAGSPPASPRPRPPPRTVSRARSLLMYFSPAHTHTHTHTHTNLIYGMPICYWDIGACLGGGDGTSVVGIPKWYRTFVFVGRAWRASPSSPRNGWNVAAAYSFCASGSKARTKRLQEHNRNIRNTCLGIKVSHKETYLTYHPCV